MLVGDYSGEQKTTADQAHKPVIAVTMATSRQGMSVIRHLLKTKNFHVRALVREPSSKKSMELSQMKNVELVKGDLLNKESLKECFAGVYGIYGNTTPTKGWKIFKGSMDSNYELKQGRNLIDSVKDEFEKGNLEHFIFSSVCKPKDPLVNVPAPGHFSSKWRIEDYIFMNNLNSKTTILRPVSYFENFNSNLPGVKISEYSFPGLVNAESPWQTIAVDDIGLWAMAAFQNPTKFLGISLNIAGEELTGNQMAETLNRLKGKEKDRVKYIKVPRTLIRIIEDDLALMGEWIERTGYGADLGKLKVLANEMDIKLTSLESWLEKKEIKKRWKDLLPYSLDIHNTFKPA